MKVPKNAWIYVKMINLQKLKTQKNTVFHRAVKDFMKTRLQKIAQKIANLILKMIFKLLFNAQSTALAIGRIHKIALISV